MPITCEAPGSKLRLTPGLPFIAARHHQTAILMGVLSQETAELPAVRRPENIGLARISPLDLSHDARFGPRKATIVRECLPHHQG